MSHARNGAASQACAACKYQRRKCASNCPLAPYFPADKQQQFLNVHRLFGVSNVVKMLTNLEPHEKDDSMKSVIFQSNLRAMDPVGGCCRLICEYERKVDVATTELVLLRQKIALCQAELQQRQNHDPIPQQPISRTTTTTTNVDNNDVVVHPELPQRFGFQENFYEPPNLHDCGIKINGDEAFSSCSSMIPHVVKPQQQQVFPEEYEDLNPIFLDGHPSQIAFGSKEPLQYSSDNVTTEEVALSQFPKEEPDLKCAASSFFPDKL